MLCKLKYHPRDSESCQPLCQTVMIFRECNCVFPWWYNYSFLNHLSTLNGLFPFPYNSPFWLMGLEGFRIHRTGFEPGIQHHWDWLWQNGSFPPTSGMFFIFSTSSAKLPFSICRKRYIIWRSRAKYLIWMIMLQVSHQDCSAWITNYLSSTLCLLQGTQRMAAMMRDDSNKWGPGQLMPWAGWRTRKSKDDAISGQRRGWAPSNRLAEVVIGALYGHLVWLEGKQPSFIKLSQKRLHMTTYCSGRTGMPFRILPFSHTFSWLGAWIS